MISPSSTPVFSSPSSPSLPTISFKYMNLFPLGFFRGFFPNLFQCTLCDCYVTTQDHSKKRHNCSLKTHVISILKIGLSSFYGTRKYRERLSFHPPDLSVLDFPGGRFLVASAAVWPGRDSTSYWPSVFVSSPRLWRQRCPYGKVEEGQIASKKDLHGRKKGRKEKKKKKERKKILGLLVNLCDRLSLWISLEWTKTQGSSRVYWPSPPFIFPLFLSFQPL